MTANALTAHAASQGDRDRARAGDRNRDGGRDHDRDRDQAPEPPANTTCLNSALSLYDILLSLPPVVPSD